MYIRIFYRACQREEMPRPFSRLTEPVPPGGGLQESVFLRSATLETREMDHQLQGVVLSLFGMYQIHV